MTFDLTDRLNISKVILKRLKNDTMTFDSRGHFRGGPDKRDLNFIFAEGFMPHLTPDEFAILKDAIDGNKQLDRFIKIYPKSFIRTCYDCGEQYVLETDGKTVRITTECPYPNGHPEFSVIAYVPSGKLVFANDMRDLFPEVNDNFNVNQLGGIIQTTEAYANAGIFHTFVGNTCPGIFKEGPTKINIGCDAWDENENVIDTVGGVEVGSICTDLWWFGAADYNDVILRGGLKNVLTSTWTTIVTVEPGTYKMTCRHHLADYKDDYDPSLARLFATIEKIG
jgi:hypothetical protein